MRVQLRPFHTDDQLKEIYREPYDHTRWADHVERIEFTKDFIRRNVPNTMTSVADLSAGDGAIATWMASEWKMSLKPVLGDLVHRDGFMITGPIEKTIREVGYNDVMIMTETLEHVQDPDEILYWARASCAYLILSTPIGEKNNFNYEHYWGWDPPDIQQMLFTAGFTTVHFEEFTPQTVRYYDFQFWVAR